MSGRKDYPVMMSQMEHEIQKVREKINKNNRKIQDKIQREMAVQASRFEQRLGELGGNIQALGQEIQQMERNFSSRLKSMRTQLRQEIQDVRAEARLAVESLRQEIRLERENKEKTAKEWLKVLDYVAGEMERLQAGRFRPQDAAKLENTLKLARENASNGIFEAAVSLSQQQYVESFAIRADLEVVNAAAARLEAETAAMLEELEKLAGVPVMQHEYATSDGKTQAVDIDAAYWAEETWQSLLQKLAEIRERFRAGRNSATLEALQAMRDEADALLQLYAAAQEESVRKHFSSIATMDQTEVIVEHLLQQGFDVVDNFFEGQDDRKANIVLLENAAGEKILIRIVPEGSLQHVKVSFNSLNPATHGARLEALHRAIEVEPVEEPGYETRPAPKEDFDLERYRATQKARQ